MRAYRALALLCASCALAGCGGGSSPTRSTPVAARFDVDVASGKVTVTQQSTGRAIVTGGAVSFTSSDLLSEGGDAGKRLIRIQATNRSGETWSNPKLVIEGIQNSSVASIMANVRVSAFAGSGTSGSADGYRTSAQFANPRGVALVPGAPGGLYVSDPTAHTIRRIEPDGMVSTLAGTAGSSGTADGTGAAARFNQPNHIGADSAGNVFVPDRASHRIRRVTPLGEVTKIAGDGTSGDTDGAGDVARFDRPTGLAVSADGNRIYVTCEVRHTIRLVKYNSGPRDLATSYVVSTIAGSPGLSGSADGVGSAARFFYPRQLTIMTDGAGNEVLYVVEVGNYLIRRISAPASGAAEVSTIAGVPLTAGDLDGPGSAATLTNPSGITGMWIDASRFVLFVSDRHKVRAVFNRPGSEPTQAGNYEVVTLAGAASSGFADGDGNAARFNYLYSLVAVPGAGPSATLYAADHDNRRIRMINVSSGAIHSGGAGSAVTEPVRVMNWEALVPNRTAYAIDMDHVGQVACDADVQFYIPNGVSGFSFTAYVECDTDTINLPAAGASYLTTLAGTGAPGLLDGPGKGAQFERPWHVLAVPAAKRSPFRVSSGKPVRAFVTEWDNHRIRYIDTDGFVGTFVGSVMGFADGVTEQARFSAPAQMALHPDGSLLVADAGNCRIRRVTPSGRVGTVAGTGTAGHADGWGDAAFFQTPKGIAVTPGGDVYVADQFNHVVRKIVKRAGDPGLSSSYYVTTAAGLPGASGNSDGVGSAARFNLPINVAWSPDGTIYVADYDNFAVRSLTNLGGSPTVGTHVGGLSGRPWGVAVDAARHVYFTNYEGCTVLRDSVVLMGSGVGFDDGTSGRFTGPGGVSFEERGTLLVADVANHAVRALQRVLSDAQPQ